MNLRMKVYAVLVNRVPAIRRRYHDIREQDRSRTGRICAWCALIGMNIAWIFGKRRFGIDPLNPDKDKKAVVGVSESSLSRREPPVEFAGRLMQYDVISFDIFDTLIFRPFSKPSDVFFLLSEKLDYPDLMRIRQEMEAKARALKWKTEGHGEITLAEIWEVMERECGIDKAAGMQLEIDTESEVCFANPYMSEVFRHLKDCGKKIIAVSDMYLSADVIKCIVENCGFEGINKYYVSCEYRMSKGDGRLYQLVMDDLGKALRYIHTGDNQYSDINKARAVGWSVEYYRNVNKAGALYRAEDMSVITGSVYRGMVNAHIHNGLYEYNREYELGFIYGGIFVQGYCRFIHEYTRTHEIDKILFLSRDGDILNQVYSMLYPEESENGRTEYVYWSRLAATKMGAGYFKYDYFRRFLYHKVNQGYTLLSVFRKMEIEDMLDACIAYLNENTEDNTIQGKYHSESILTDRFTEHVKEFLIGNWEEVLEHYEEQLEAGKMYYETVLQGCKKVAAVDVGWAGSGAVVLDHIVNHIWKMECEVIGILAGTNTIHNVEPDMSEAQLVSGKLVSYLFSQEHNRDIWKLHDIGCGHNIFWEILLGSPTKSFCGFEKAGNGYGLLYNNTSEGQAEKWQNLQKGIKKWISICGNQFNNRNISGRDVYACMRNVISDSEFMNMIGDEFKLNINLD